MGILNLQNRITINSVHGGGFNPLDFNPFNIWDSEHATVVSTTTTWQDYNTGVKLDLANITAGGQPTLVSNDPDFGGVDSFSFDGNDFLRHTINNYRSSDTEGSFYFAFRAGSTVTGVFTLFSSNNGSSTTSLMRIDIFDGNIFFAFTNAGTQNQLNTTTTTLLPNTNYVLRVTGVGSGDPYEVEINSVVQSLNLISGANDSKWFSQVPGTRDYIYLGTVQLGASTKYFNGKITFAGYYPVLSSDDNDEMFGNLL